MNTTVSERMLRVGPMALRWGLAAILIYNGFNQVSGSFGAETGESFLADAQGIELSANWGSVLGVAQLAVGALLAVGLFTRITSLAVLATVGFSAYSGITGTAPDPQVLTDAVTTTGATAPAMNIAGQLFQANGGALLLLAAACASLLFSGAGCLSWDTRGARRGRELEMKLG